MRYHLFPISLMLFLYYSFSPAALASEKEWLLWDEEKSSLPAQIARTDYPPVILFRQGNNVLGSFSTPYSFESNTLPTTEDFRVLIVDSENTTHTLTHTHRSIGFVGDKGMSIVTLKASDVAPGDVKVQIFKKHTQENVDKLSVANEKVARHSQNVKAQLDSLELQEMKINEQWSLTSTGADGKNYDLSQINSEWIIIDLYSQYCSPCVRSVPELNKLHALNNIYVVGLSGTKQLPILQQHIEDKNISYPMIPFIGQYMDAALPKALGTVGYPTYYLLDSNRKLVNKYIGANALNHMKKRMKVHLN